MEKDIGYSENFLSSFNQMRKNQFICDFTVKIGNESFPVHRVVLAAASKYFTGMFSSNMKEVQKEFVDMKNLDVEGVRQCIEYMYTGCIKLSHDSVEYTLKASHYIQLDGLTSICFNFLQKHISVPTCISSLNISSLCGRDDVSKLVETFNIQHFEAVTLTEMFPLISKSDPVHYIEDSGAKYQVAWQAVMRWFSVAEEKTSTELLDVMKSINLIQLPVKFILETVLTEPLVIENRPCKNFVIPFLFDDAEAIKSNLNTENVFTVKNLTKVCEIPNAEKIKEAIGEYLEDNFEELTNKEGFCQLEEEDIINLFQSSKTKYSSEKLKWDSALIWVKHDQRHREKVFNKLFESLKLEVFSRKFLRETVLTETIVNESQTCQNMLLRTLFDKIYFFDNGNLLELNLKQMKWIPKQPLVEGQNDFVAVVVFQQRIYVLNRDCLSYYTPADDAWVKNLKGCELVGLFCSASSDKFIYAMGGWDDEKDNADAKWFNLDTQSWSPITSMNTGRNAASAAVFQKMVFVVGGQINSGYLDLGEVYIPIAKVWTYIKSMCVTRRFPSTCVANNRLYVVGGASDEKGKLLDPYSIEVYDEDTGGWEIVAEKSFDRGEIKSFAISLEAEYAY